MNNDIPKEFQSILDIVETLNSLIHYEERGTSKFKLEYFKFEEVVAVKLSYIDYTNNEESFTVLKQEFLTWKKEVFKNLNMDYESYFKGVHEQLSKKFLRELLRYMMYSKDSEFLTSNGKMKKCKSFQTLLGINANEYNSKLKKSQILMQNLNKSVKRKQNRLLT